MGLSGQDIIELLAWILFVAGAIWVPIKFHKPHYNPFEQKALLILGIVPGSVLLIILGLYKSNQGNPDFPHAYHENDKHQAVRQHNESSIEQMPLECGVIQSVRYDENDVVLEIQFEPSMQIRRFSYPHQGRTFEAQRRICIREDLNIDRGDFDYLKQAD